MSAYTDLTLARGMSRAIAASLVMALLLGAGVARADSAGPIACGLVTAPDLQAAFGAAFSPLEAHFPRSSCAYTKGGRGMVSIVVTAAGGSAEETLRGRRGMFKGKATPAPELGPAAFVITGARSMSVHFGKGKWVAQLEATSEVTTDAQKLVQLAKKALSHE